MKVSIELPVEDWNYILEVLSSHPLEEIKRRAVAMIQTASEKEKEENGVHPDQ